MVMLSKSLFVTKIFCRGLDIRVTEVVMTRFDIIRLHMVEDLVAYIIIYFG